MEIVHAVYKQEDAGWSAQSPEAPGYRAFAASLEEVIGLAHEGIPFFLEREVAVLDTFEEAAANASITATTVSAVTSTTGAGGGLILSATGAHPATVPNPVPTVRSADVSKVPAQQVA